MRNPQGHLSAGFVRLQAPSRQIYGNLQSDSVAGVSMGERVKSRGNVSVACRGGAEVEPYRNTYTHTSTLDAFVNTHAFFNHCASPLTF